jgi:hypothetical protein
MQVYALNSLVSSKSISAFPEVPQSRSIDMYVAKNSYASFHIVLCNDDDFDINTVEISKNKGIRSSYNFAEDVVFADSKYPDILSNERTCQVTKNTNQSIWITFFIENDAEAIQHEIDINLITSCQNIDVKCNLKVFDISLPDTKDSSFLMEYWIHVVNSWFRWPDSKSFDCIKYYYDCDKYSDKWWKINGAMAQNMKESRINVLFVRTMDLLFDGGTTIDRNGKVNFKWELFDRWVELYLERGGFKKLAGMHLVMQAEGKQVFIIKRGENGESELGLAEEESNEAVNWLEQYLPALYQHIEEKGYKDMWLQHVQDEPMASGSWVSIIKYVNKYMPGIPTLDAIDNQAPMPDLQNKMDLWIPRVDIYEENREFYDYRLAKGDKRWVYTCCLPTEMNYVNKFIDWPMIHNRVIAWGCFANYFSGFLHWGYDFWDPEGELFGLNTNAKVKGDGFIIYPDSKNSSIKNSVRMLATRDSAQDYELLNILAERNPKLSFEIAKKIIRRFNDFNWNPTHFEKVRCELLRSIESLNEK